MVLNHVSAPTGKTHSRKRSDHTTHPKQTQQVLNLETCCAAQKTCTTSGDGEGDTVHTQSRKNGQTLLPKHMRRVTKNEALDVPAGVVSVQAKAERRPNELGRKGKPTKTKTDNIKGGSWRTGL